MFTNTVNMIYIVNGGSANASTWRTIASGYANVHYEADDNPTPTINSFSAIRVASSGSTTPSPTGTWAYIEALVTVYSTLLPTGWVAGLKSRALEDNGTAVSPTWQPSSITSYPVTIYCWIGINDSAKHNLSLAITDAITRKKKKKASKTSAIVTTILPKIYALVDYYHDDNTGTEGMAIGKLAEDADLLDIAMPTLFRDDLTAQDMTAQEVSDFVDALDASGGGIDFSIVTASQTQSVAPGSGTFYLTPTIPSGYRGICVAGFGVNYAECSVNICYWNGTQIVIQIRNNYSTALNITVTGYLLVFKG